METKPSQSRFKPSQGAFDVSLHDADVRRTSDRETTTNGTLANRDDRVFAAGVRWHRRIDWMLLGALTVFMVIGGILLAMWWVF